MIRIRDIRVVINGDNPSQATIMIDASKRLPGPWHDEWTPYKWVPIPRETVSGDKYRAMKEEVL